MGKKKRDNFDLTLDECKAVFDAIGGLVIVDKEGRIKYFSEDIIPVIEALNAKAFPQKIIGEKIDEVHPTTKILAGLEQEAKDQICIYNGSGVTNITRIIPVKNQEKVIGAIDLDLFSSSWDLSLFLKQINPLIQKNVIHLPEKIDDIYELPKKNGGKYTIGDLVGSSEQMKKLREQIYQLLESRSTVLITGETGTGKEIVAHAIYGVSGRQMYPFIQVNCAAIPESLFEAEFFGYEEGTFTGGKRGGKAGIFEEANNGTVFLDEVDQIPYNMQPKLLRVLQEQEIVRVGGVEKKPINVRIIAATNKDLKKSVAEQMFREDLYYRLNVVSVKIPPLRSHKEDIPELARSRCYYLNKVLGKNIKGVSDDALALLLEYDWPGNVRELFNSIERSYHACPGGYLSAKYFNDIFVNTQQGSDAESVSTDLIGSLEKIMKDTEKKSIQQALKLTSNNKTQAAKLLGIGRTSLHNKIKKYGLLE